MNKHVENLKKLASEGIKGNALSSEDYVRFLSDTLPLISMEFSKIKISVPNKHVERLCEDWRRGVVDRIAQDSVENKINLEDLNSLCEPYGILEIKRVSEDAKNGKPVILKLDREKAEDLAWDLGCGIYLREEEERDDLEAVFGLD